MSAVGGGTPAFDSTAAYFLGSDHSITAIDAATGKTRWRASTATVGDAPADSDCELVDAFVACGDSGIVALRRADGSRGWRFDVPNEQPGKFQFRVSNNTVFAGSFGHGTIYAIDGATGLARWTAPVLATDPNDVNIPKLATDGEIVVGVFVRFTKP